MMTEATTRAPELLPAPAPRRRTRLVPVALAVLLLAGAVGVFLVHRSVTRPLLSGNGSMGRFPGEDVESNFDEREEVRVDYQNGGTYTFEFSLRNESRWPVRVVDFPIDDDGLGLLEPFGFAVDTTPLEGPTRTFVPFSPFTIDPGEEALVEVQARFQGCEHYGADTFATLLALEVRYRALWATRTRFVDLPVGVQVPAPDSCPD